MPGHTADLQILSRTCSQAKLNLPVWVFKVLTSAAAINGWDQAEREQCPGLEVKQEGAGRHRIETGNWVMCSNQIWVLEVQVSPRAGNVDFRRDKEL